MSSLFRQIPHAESIVIPEIHYHELLFLCKANRLSRTAAEFVRIPEAEAAGIGILHKADISFLHAAAEIAVGDVFDRIGKRLYAVELTALLWRPSCRLFFAGARQHKMKLHLRIKLTQPDDRFCRKRIPADRSAGIKILYSPGAYPPFKNAVQTFLHFRRLRNNSVSRKAS